MNAAGALPLLVDVDGKPPLPWLAEPLARVLATHRGHALLVQGHAGAGVLPFVLSLAQGWLCESDPATSPAHGACGRCASCRLVHSRAHPDLQVLLPQALRREHEWLVATDLSETEAKKPKPSRQIRIDEVRAVIDAVLKTSARGRGKVVVLQPAEAINAQAANALLKTLEEPPAGTRLVLACSDASLLLPTIRSRCQLVPLLPPPREAALAWLGGRGVAEPAVMLAAAGGLPLDVLDLAAAGIDATRWRAVPTSLARGQAGALQGLPLPRVLEALAKLCHDAMAQAAGGAGRYFPADAMPPPASMTALAAWSRDLARITRFDEHPWNEPLLLDALVAAAARALRPADADPADRGPASATRFVTLHP
jgi:DNA polymerase III subunit delta'